MEELIEKYKKPLVAIATGLATVVAGVALVDKLLKDSKDEKTTSGKNTDRQGTMSSETEETRKL